jgi:hypothetical protein
MSGDKIIEPIETIVFIFEIVDNGNEKACINV